MQIVYHIGANRTDGERLLKSLMRNTGALAQRGVAVPGPGKYRNLIRDTLMALDGQAPGPDTRDLLLEQILDGQIADRMVLSNSTFLALPPKVFEGGRFFGQAEQRLQAFAALFPGDDLELYLALRNPATFIPGVFAQSKARSEEAFLGGADPMALRWSDLVARIRQALPQVGLTVWCNEDTPLIWGDLLQRLANAAPGEGLVGRHDLIAAIMKPEGYARFESYLASHPPASDLQERRIIGAFLDKYALSEEIEEEVDMPGWTDTTVNALTAAYEADVARILAMDGVSFVAP